MRSSGVSGGAAEVAMMEAADHRLGDDLAAVGRLGVPRRGRGIKESKRNQREESKGTFYFYHPYSAWVLQGPLQIANKPGTYWISVINGASSDRIAVPHEIPPGAALTVTVP